MNQAANSGIKREVLVIETGIANVASIFAAFSRLGFSCRLSSDAKEVALAPRVVLPGVGAFGAGMERLRARDLVSPIRDRIVSNSPTLCVCLGMQLLCEASEETLGVEGLAIIPQKVRKFRAPLKCPHFGWNLVEAGNLKQGSVEQGCGLRFIESGYAYFANSYYLENCPSDWVSSTTDYGIRFISSIQRGAVLACQFHPELSGKWGSDLINRWLQG